MHMQTVIILSSIWGVITIAFIGLLLYRGNLTRKESDWIPMTEDSKEDSAIKAQKVIEMKTQKLTFPIRALGTLSVIMLVVIIGLWFYISLVTPPAIMQ